MTPDEFKFLVAGLTGRGVRGRVDDQLLGAALSDDSRSLDYSQFNELLLLVNKNRVEEPFFEVFFGGRSSIGLIEAGVTKFRIAAMLRYGNFIHAFKTWSQCTSREGLRLEVGRLLNSGVVPRTLTERGEPLVDIRPIQGEHTYFVGETTSEIVLSDVLILKALLAAFEELDAAGLNSWSDASAEFQKLVEGKYHGRLERMITRFRATQPGADVNSFRERVEATRERMATLEDECLNAIATAEANLDTYLTWDHMDVYIATSMRVRADFESVHRFAQELMNHPELTGKDMPDIEPKLNLRFFDPTQSKANNRVNKGLVEALMLKRAFCTIYSVQDSDTLGKDSELAATLAQGKPVIAYVPEMGPEDVERRVEQLLDSDASVPYSGYHYVCHSNREFAESCHDRYHEVIRRIQESQVERFWESEDVGKTLREVGADDPQATRGFALAWAQAEKALYDKRAKVLGEFHPLAFQVNLASGVANGLLVARSVRQCALLVRAIATRRLEFYIDDDAKDRVSYLRERETGSPFRVVTTDEKLTNSFWSFYFGDRRDDRGEL